MTTHSNQAEFARLMKVSRKTVTIWKKRGYLEISAGLVDVARSIAKLASVGKGVPAGVTSAAIDSSGLDINARTRLLWETAGPHREHVSTVSSMIAPYDVARLLLRYLPQETVRPLVAEYVALSRRGAAELLEEGRGILPPPGFNSWAEHPWFNPETTEAEWAEYEAEAKITAAGRLVKVIDA